MVEAIDYFNLRSAATGKRKIRGATGTTPSRNLGRALQHRAANNCSPYKRDDAASCQELVLWHDPRPPHFPTQVLA